MENKSISQIVQDRIKGEGIKPISRTLFSIKRVLFWVAVISSFIVGSVAFALVLSALFNNDWYLYSKLGFNFVFKTLPYFWVISLILFTVLGEYYYRKTLLGHRHGLIMIMAVYLISTTIVGSVLYVLRIGDFVEQSLENKVPSYSIFITNRQEVWFHPEDGLLRGAIVEPGDKKIKIIDVNGVVWVVNIENSVNNTLLQVVPGDRVKIIGDKTSDNTFDADDIRPWMGMR